MQAISRTPEATWFTPGLRVRDAGTEYWVRQAVLRLRRELCWAWRQPQSPDPLTDALDRSRLHEQRVEFFERDETARHLTAAIAWPPPAAPGDCARGTLPWLERELGLAPAEIFTLALVLMNTWDAAAGEVIGAAQGDARRTLPTLGLVQRLWDEPGTLAGLASRSSPLFRLGILRADPGEALDWRTPLSMSPLVAQRLLGVADGPPAGFTAIHGNSNGSELALGARLVARLACEPISAPHAIRLRAASSLTLADGAGVRRLLEGFSAITGRPVYTFFSSRPPEMQTAATVCWLDGADLYLVMPASGDAPEMASAPFTDIPIYVLALSDSEKLAVPGWRMLPTVDIPVSDLKERMDCWKQSFAPGTAPPEAALEDCAFRFRFDGAVIREIAGALGREPGPVSREKLAAACRQRAAAAPGSLAVRVRPRFESQELVLPPAQQRQFEELVTAVRTLSTVHARWGTGRVWDEAGISALFAGPPGTGKTMAAEVLAARLGLPMFRVDLSQVVNKYIGETEKNLRRL
ncbi:MAG TPA: ATP-binding protein, partial [Bryobacteraceae bacterium]|nr:ATP-binding protein [Bryobacteraceae bacterium]